ncbi:mtor-associated protein meak7 [Anaeramoeba ignava]|uniref:Oxidation resistance protein 1 n=1 Tax=Anaeramoeba ignava TaxID=1746090 RepID=A0A9Q0RBW2_ANAIG|nr:mtor-associated protein meak7 [Anaeramoeba ignava]
MNQVNSQTTFDSPFFPKDGKIQLSPAFDAILKLPRVISMIEEAESREKKLLKMDVEINENPFADSEILSGTGLESVLFLCLPFKTQPETALLYSSSRDGFSIKKMHDFIDNSGPVVFLLKKNEQIFGGFVSTSINCEQKFFGSTKSFLFNLFYDTKIPFIGENSKCIFSSENSIKFGSTDLILQNDFLDCKSEIESCFGVGFEKGSDDAKTFLAGSYQFIPDIVEVFGFVKSN